MTRAVEDRCQICGMILGPAEDPNVCAEPDCGRIGHEQCGAYAREPSGTEFWRCGVCWDEMAEEVVECSDCGIVVPSEEAVVDAELLPATPLDPPLYGDLCRECAERRAWRKRRVAG